LTFFLKRGHLLILIILFCQQKNGFFYTGSGDWVRDGFENSIEKASPTRKRKTVSPAKARKRAGRTTKVLKKEEVIRGTSSIQRLMTQLRIKPHFSSGKPDGFLISHIQKGSLVENAGLQNGDIIKGINDIKIDSPSKLLEAYRDLDDASLIEIEIERGGAEKEYLDQG